MVAPARRAAFRVLEEVELYGKPSDESLHGDIVARLRPIDRNLTTEIIYGTLRLQGWLDHLLGGITAGRWESVYPKARLILRMSLYQAARMSRVPDHAIVNDAVELAKQVLKGRAAAFVNGVLRRLVRDRPWNDPGFEQRCPPWVRASLPRWLWERWRARFGEDAALAYALSLNQPPDRTGWFLQEPASEEAGAGFEKCRLVPGAFSVRKEPGGSGSAEAPLIHYQDEASQLIPHLLGRARGMCLWDACAAPGGKAAILARLAGSDGRVFASDASFGRTVRLRDFLRNAGGNSRLVLAADAGAAPPFRAEFDAVLADVPCSGLGTLRRNPEIKWRLQPRRLGPLRDAQLAILGQTSTAVRRGGLLLYSTCSTEPEENEEVVRAFLALHPGFRVIRPQSPPGIDCWLDDSGFLRTFPGAERWDGFFAALMLRIS
jgi:16S rRNA (cytosine967-C5)-methyltransferase